MGRKLDEQFMDSCLKEYSLFRQQRTPDEADLAETALFLEEVFGLRMSDAEISSGSLARFDDIRAFVRRKLSLPDGK